mmetsp:Transcript_13820/g.48810  ORF Transcript_13820/g.48810 Transcript_13820/m.48810 type:complete len:334 (-) Transcript_13820:26-1027(-)
MGLGAGGAYYGAPQGMPMQGMPPNGVRSPYPTGPPSPYMTGGYGGASPGYGGGPPASGGSWGVTGGPAPGSSFLNLFGDSQLSLQEIADKARQLQQKIDENAEQEKANLRAAAEQKHQEIERHAAELSRHAASSIEAYKTTQLQASERQKSYHQAVVRQQAEQAKRLIDQQAAQAISAVEARDRHLDLQRQSQEMGQRGATRTSSFQGGPMDNYGSPTPGFPPGSGSMPSMSMTLPAQGMGPMVSHHTNPSINLHGIPVSAADAQQYGSLGAAAAAQLQSSESYSGLSRIPPTGVEGPNRSGHFGSSPSPPFGSTLPPGSQFQSAQSRVGSLY